MFQPVSIIMNWNERYYPGNPKNSTLKNRYNVSKPLIETIMAPDFFKALLVVGAFFSESSS